jgi:Protein of unknown function (DUF2909)
MKLLIVLALVGVVLALGSAGVLMLRKGQRGVNAGDEDPAVPMPVDRNMARALAVRVAISVSLFLLVLLAWSMGWVQPTGLPVGR